MEEIKRAAYARADFEEMKTELAFLTDLRDRFKRRAKEVKGNKLAGAEFTAWTECYDLTTALIETMKQQIRVKID